MKLSVAIRLGAMMKPQYFVGDMKTLGGSCALMAAGDAIGVEYMKIHAPKIWPILATPAVCPQCRYSGCLETVIAYCLNDKHRWARERIADWVYTIESQETAHDLQPEPNQDVLDMPHSPAIVSGGVDK